MTGMDDNTHDDAVEDLLQRLAVLARFTGNPIKLGQQWLEYLDKLSWDVLLDAKLALRAALAAA